MLQQINKKEEEDETDQNIEQIQNQDNIESIVFQQILQYENNQFKENNLWNFILVDDMPSNSTVPSLIKDEQKVSNQIEMIQNADVIIEETGDYILTQTSNSKLNKEWSIEYFNEINQELENIFIENQNLILNKLVENNCFLCKYLTKGGEGQIFEGYIKQNANPQVEVAFKIIFNTNEAEIREEISIMTLFERNVKHVIKFHRALQISESIWILVIEKCQHSLYNELKMIQEVKKVFPTIQFFKMMFDLFEGLIHFKIYNILHLDIKPGNILISNDGNCVYTDFGLSQLKKQGKQIKFKGCTPYYAPIEQTNQDFNQNMEFNSDIYSLGKTIEQIVNIFRNINRDNTISNFFMEEIVKMMIQDDINSREKCEDLHKKIILNLIYGKLKDYQYILVFCMTKLDMIIQQYKYDANKNIPYLLDIDLYYNQIYLEIFQCKIFNDKSLQIQNSIKQSPPNLSLSQPQSQITLSNNMEIEKALCNQLEQIQLRKKLFNSKSLKILSYLIRNVGQCYQNIGNLENALQFSKYSYEIINEIILGNHPEIAVSLNNLGLCYLNISDFDNALVYCEQSLQMRKQLFKNNHPEMVTSLNNVGACLQNLGQQDLALKNYKQSLSIKQEFFKRQQPKDVQKFHLKIEEEIISKIEINQKQQMIYSSPTHTKQNYSVMQNFIRNKHLVQIGFSDHTVTQHNRFDIPEIAILYNNIGTCYYSIGDFYNAEKHIDDSMRMLQKIFEGNHPLIATVLANLGQCKLKNNNIFGALENHQQSLQIRREIFDENNSDIASSLNCVGICMTRHRYYEKALEYFLESLKIRSKQLNQSQSLFADGQEENKEPNDTFKKEILNSQNLTESNNQLIDQLISHKSRQYLIEKQKNNDVFNDSYAIKIEGCLTDIKKQQKNFEEFQSFLKTRKQNKKDSNQDLLISLFNIGECYRSIGNTKLALDYHLKSLQFMEKIYQKNHYYTATSLYTIGLCYTNLGDFKNSLKFTQKSLVMFEKIFEGNHFQIATSLYSVGNCYLNLNDTRNSLIYLFQSLEMFENIEDSQHHLDIISCLVRIGRCYEKITDFQAALNFYHYSLEIIKNNQFTEQDILNNFIKIAYCSSHSFNKNDNLPKEIFQISIILKNINPKDMFDYFYEFEINLIEINCSLKDQILEYLINSLNIWKKMYIKNHPSIAMSLFYIALFYQKTQKYDKALCFHLEALYMRKQILHIDSIDIENSQNHVGFCYLFTHNPLFALFFNQKNLMLFEKQKIPNLSSIASSLSNIGICYSFMGDDQKAFQYHVRSLEICQQLSLMDNPKTAQSLLNIGMCCLTLEKWDSAISFFNQALNMIRKWYYDQHLSLALLLFGLGVSYQYLGQPIEAYNFYSQFLVTHKKVMNESHHKTETITAKLENCSEEQGMCENTKQIFLKSFKRIKQFWSPFGNEVIISLKARVHFYQQIGEYQNALKYSVEILEMLIQLHKMDHAKIANSLLLVGECYQCIGENEISQFYKIESQQMKQRLTKLWQL